MQNVLKADFRASVLRKPRDCNMNCGNLRQLKRIDDNHQNQRSGQCRQRDCQAENISPFQLSKIQQIQEHQQKKNRNSQITERIGIQTDSQYNSRYSIKLPSFFPDGQKQKINRCSRNPQKQQTIQSQPGLHNKTRQHCNQERAKHCKLFAEKFPKNQCTEKPDSHP